MLHFLGPFDPCVEGGGKGSQESCSRKEIWPVVYLLDINPTGQLCYFSFFDSRPDHLDFKGITIFCLASNLD